MHQKVSREPAAVDLRQKIEVYFPKKSENAPGQASRPESRPLRLNRVAKPIRNPSNGRSAARRGPPPSNPSRDVAISFSRPESAHHEGRLYDRQISFDVCPMLDRTPQQEIEEFEEELFVSDFGSKRRGVFDV